MKRIGSILESFEKYLATKKHVGIFLLRIFISIRLIYGVIDNIISWDHMAEFSDFLQHYGFPLPTMNAVISVYAQLFCAIFLLIGYKTRFASIILVINFLVALLFIHIKANDTVEGMTPALAMLFGCLTLLFTGADKLSLDHRLNQNGSN